MRCLLFSVSYSSGSEETYAAVTRTLRTPPLPRRKRDSETTFNDPPSLFQQTRQKQQLQSYSLQQ